MTRANGGMVLAIAVKGFGEVIVRPGQGFIHALWEGQRKKKGQGEYIRAAISGGIVIIKETTRPKNKQDLNKNNIPTAYAVPDKT
jgi:hypothetical protein